MVLRCNCRLARIAEVKRVTIELVLGMLYLCALLARTGCDVQAKPDSVTMLRCEIVIQETR